MLAHRSIIAGAASELGGVSFHAFDPSRGHKSEAEFVAATSKDVDLAATAARRAFDTRPDGGLRAKLLETIASNIETMGENLLKTASSETGLAVPRLASERDRTTFTLRMFAELAREGSWVEAVIEHGDASRQPLPKPDLRRMLVPVGPVAVFGASNFPLAYSVGGGDTASALAAGCPVVVKGHSMHPATGEMVAGAIASAVQSCGLHPGFFSFVHAGGERDVHVGLELVAHPDIRAVGFTGSVGAGVALTKAASEREHPIPVFAEMGSVNPVFVLPHAMQARCDEIAAKLAASVTASGGQMCTCPGLIFVVKGERADSFVASLRSLIAATPPIVMLGNRTRDNYVRRVREIGEALGVVPVQRVPGEGAIMVRAALFEATARQIGRSVALREECFGPAAIVVRCDDESEMIQSAASIEGSLTGTVHTDPDDADLARRLMTGLLERVGRVVVNGVPTGVEVSPAMVHSGPFPACSRPETSAVGSSAIRRWCRPVCFQNVPDGLLPPELREGNPGGIARSVDGRWEPRVGASNRA